MRAKERILIIGGYGFSNIGDEAIFSGLLRYLSDMGYNKDLYDITVFSKNPSETSRIHSVNATNRIFNKILNSDRIIIGGGELFSEYKGLLYKNLFIVIVAKMLARRVDLIGIGIDIKLRVSRFLVKFVFKLVDSISVRDKESLRTLQNLGINNVSLVRDLAFYNLKPLPSPVIDEFLKQYELISKPFIIVSIRPSNDPDLMQNYTQIIGEFARGSPMVFVPFSKHPFSYEDNDLNVIPYMKDMIKNKQIIVFDRVSNLHPNEVLYLISKSKMVISSRLHPLVFAKAVNVKAVAILPPFQPKKVHEFAKEHNIPIVTLPTSDAKFMDV